MLTHVSAAGAVVPCIDINDLLCYVQIDVGYTERTVSISNYPLSAALACAKVCGAFEEKWGVK
jgi:hypothetical protein